MKTDTQTVIDSFIPRRDRAVQAEHVARKNKIERTKKIAFRFALGLTALAGATVLADKAATSLESEVIPATPQQAEVMNGALEQMGRGEKPADTQTTTTDTMVVTVQSGDTPWGIASEHKPEGELRPLVDEISNQANADGDGMQPGEKIVIPTDMLSDQ